MRTIAVVIFLAMICPAFAAPAPTREQETAACQGDAQNLCSDYIPDEQQIAACLYQKISKLTPACRTIFKAALKQRRGHGN